MVYNYTKPRGPIAAMYSSPGPCYGLPGLVGQKFHDPRSLHNKGPAYPFGIRHGKFRDDCSPGPCYLLNPKVYKDGTDGTPSYSLYGRKKDLSVFKVPGPGAYSPEKAGPTSHHRHPAHSFGTRHQNRKTDNTPAANNYTLPDMTGKTVQSGKKQSPIYSMTGRQTQGGFGEDMAKAPGPGTYGTTDPNAYKSKAALYSMTSRNMMPGDTTKKPGPGAHSPENVYINKKQNPTFSFGIRHSQYLAPLIVDVQD
ncbi:outer dense fiber protein 3-like [Mizuhopecten yessoensis]|uniref:outer dense fiber protein 3-like n=1 Tax=Mizuhopecten yessoensis TaxID=6573 RepID=UPI000B45A0BF|nr:outer dense fiber protein 3-like [Mizuhopecten yessoensis]XP_021369339.1 outer dense fiber protein 3-like [Mizuhopecten yessoensis]